MPTAPLITIAADTLYTKEGVRDLFGWANTNSVMEAVKRGHLPQPTALGNQLLWSGKVLLFWINKRILEANQCHYDGSHIQPTNVLSFTKSPKESEAQTGNGGSLQTPKATESPRPGGGTPSPSTATGLEGRVRLRSRKPAPSLPNTTTEKVPPSEREQ